MLATQYNGLDFLNCILNGDIPEAPMNITISLKIITAVVGQVDYEVSPLETHLNVQGGVHGGFSAAVMDTLTGNAVRTAIKKGQRLATIDLAIKMLRPMKHGKTYIGIGKLKSIGKNIATSEAEIKDENGKVYSTGTATLMIIHE